MIRLDQIPRSKSFSEFAKEYDRSYFFNESGRKISINPISKLNRVCNKGYTGSEKVFLDFLVCNNYQNVHNIISGDLKTIIGIIKKVNNIFNDPSPFKNNMVSQAFKKDIELIFNYDSFRDTPRSVMLFQYLNIKTCCYCNQNEIYSYTNNDKKSILTTFDHFFSQSEFPYLSISLYNLMPSCPSCNHIKGGNTFDIYNYVHPYKESLDELTKFTIDGYVLANEDDDNFQISISPSVQNSNYLNTINKFLLLPRYNSNLKKVQEIWTLRKMYPENEMQSLLTQHSIKLKRNLTNKDFWELTLMFDSDVDLTLNRPYNKLKRDIAKEFLITW